MNQDCQSDRQSKFQGRIRCAILLPMEPESKNDDHDSAITNKAGFIQISPTREGPWTIMRLNYAAPAACWRFGNDVVASEVSVKNGNRYVEIRSLVSVTNNTDFFIDLCLKSNSSSEYSRSADEEINIPDRGFHVNKFEMEEFFEIEKNDPLVGWISCSSRIPFASHPKQFSSDGENQVRKINQFLLVLLRP